MGNWYSPIPRGGLYKPHSASFLASPRLRQSILQTWKNTREQGGRAEDATNALGNAQRQLLANAAQPKTAATGYHPFKIYQFPRWMRNFKTDTDWQRFKVRYGYFGQYRQITGPGNSSPVFGTDYMASSDDTFLLDPRFQTAQIPPTNDTLVDAAGQTWNECIVPANGNKYYFWVSLSTVNDITGASPEAGLFFGNDAGNSNPPASLEEADENSRFCFSMTSGEFVVDPWPSMTYPLIDSPINDKYHYLVGLLRWNGKNFDIGQQLNNHILNISSVSSQLPSVFRGVWSNIIHYYNGDMVYTDDTVRKVYIHTAPPYIGPSLGQDPSLGDPWFLLSQSAI